MITWDDTSESPEHLYDALEIMPVVCEAGDCEPVYDLSDIPEECEAFFTLYGHLKAGGVEALADATEPYELRNIARNEYPDLEIVQDLGVTLYAVYYQRPGTVRWSASEVDISRLDETHVCVMKPFEASDPDVVFAEMQGHAWARNGGGQEFIRELGLHTSMSVGDVLHNLVSDTYLICDSFGWKEVRR